MIKNILFSNPYEHASHFVSLKNYSTRVKFCKKVMLVHNLRLINIQIRELSFL